MHLLLIFVMTALSHVATLPSHYQNPKLSTAITPHETDRTRNSIPQNPRRKKGYQFYEYVPNLHVIPLPQNQDQNNRNDMQGSRNDTQLISVLIPFHTYEYVHDLTVIPLQRVRVGERRGEYRVSEEVDRYRNPLGGYGVGWPFGGHGAGHGYHYTYYI